MKPLLDYKERERFTKIYFSIVDIKGYWRFGAWRRLMYALDARAPWVALVDVYSFYEYVVLVDLTARYLKDFPDDNRERILRQRVESEVAVLERNVPELPFEMKEYATILELTNRCLDLV